MRKILFALAVLCLIQVQVWAQAATPFTIKSPNGEVTMYFTFTEKGTPIYTLNYKGKQVIKPSQLGLQLVNDKNSLMDDFKIADTDSKELDETWNPVWG